MPCWITYVYIKVISAHRLRKYKKVWGYVKYLNNRENISSKTTSQINSCEELGSSDFERSVIFIYPLSLCKFLINLLESTCFFHLQKDLKIIFNYWNKT